MLRVLIYHVDDLNEVAILSVGFWLVLAGDMTLGMLLAADHCLELEDRIENVIAFSRASYVTADVFMLEDVLEQPLILY